MELLGGNRRDLVALHNLDRTRRYKENAGLQVAAARNGYTSSSLSALASRSAALTHEA
jgi:hypothetical protein